METYYDVLGVSEDASQDAIRAAYREKVKEYHPDVSDEPDAEQQFKRVKEAEIVLSDPEERERYDAVGHADYLAGVTPGDAADDTDRTDVQEAAARAAAGDHDAGGRSAGWRERERRARRRAGQYWVDEVMDDSDDRHDDPFEDFFPGDSGSPRGGRSRTTASSPGSAGAAADGAPGATSPAAEAAASTDSTANASRTDPPPGYAAADGWGGASDGTARHSVQDWVAEDQPISIPRPRWTQDELVLLVSTLFLYPILLFLTVLPVLPTVANVAIGLVTFALIGFLLPRPSFGLPVFATWSVLMPALLVAFEIPLVSVVGLVTLTGVWLPLLYSIAVAMVLAR